MMRERLLEAISGHKVFGFSLFGFEVEVYNSVIVMWIIMAVLVLLSLLAARHKFTPVPAGIQNLTETIVDWVNGFTRGMTGHHWMHIAPFIGTLFLFLVFSNTISIFNFLPDWEQLYELTGIGFFKSMPRVAISPPTRDINITIALAAVSMVFMIYFTIKFKNASGWLRSFVTPTPVILPVKFMEYFIRIVSLSFRLFGNILGAYIVMEIVYIFAPILVPAGLSIYFDIFDGALQAFIFVFLTSLYIGEAVE
jgi:F-type H+-transporting ATPase subunit a